MRNSLITLVFVLAFSVVLTAAQYQIQPQTEDKNSTNPQSPENRVTFTGCLEKGAVPDSFVLNNVDHKTSQKSTDRGHNEDWGQAQGNQDASQDQSKDQNENMPSEMARSEDSYGLIPEGSLNFNGYINKQVEVTGTIMPMRPRTNDPDQMSSDDSSTNNQSEIKVSSIRQISRSCK
jgi:hypothetical protein